MTVPLDGRSLTARRQRTTWPVPWVPQPPRRRTAGLLGAPGAPVAVVPPTVTVEIGFASAPGVAQAATTWTDATPYVRSVQTTMGRSPEAADFAAGTATLVLDNRDRRFDPTNTAGPYWPNVVPMRRIRIRATLGGESFPIFSGFITGWPLTPSPPGKHDIKISAIDGTEPLSLARLPSVYTLDIQTDTPSMWWRFKESVGSLLADSSNNGRHGTYTFDANELSGGSLLPYDTASRSVNLSGTQGRAAYVTNQSARLTDHNVTIECWIYLPEALLTKVGRGYIYEQGAPGSVEGFNLHYHNVGDFQILRLYVRYYGLETNRSVFTTLTPSHFGRPLHVVARWDVTNPATGSFYLDGQPANVVYSSNTYPFSITYDVNIGGRSGAGGTEQGFTGNIAELAIYNSLLSPTRIAAHYVAGAAPWDGDTTPIRLNRVLDLIGWPVAERVFDPSTFVLGPEPLNSDARSIVRRDIAAEGGRLFIGPEGSITFHSKDHESLTNDAQVFATWGDDGAVEHPYERSPKISFDRDRIINTVTGHRIGGLDITLEDTASRTAFLQRSTDIGELPVADDAVVRALLQSVLATSAQPQLRLEPFTVRPLRQSTEMWRRVLGSRVGQHHVFLHRPATGAAIEIHGRLERIEHRLSPGVTDSWEQTLTLGPERWVGTPVQVTAGGTGGGGRSSPPTVFYPSIYSLIPTAIRSTTSASFVNWPNGEAVTGTFNKRLADSRLIVTVQASGYVSATAALDYGVSIGGTDYLIVNTGRTTINDQVVAASTSEITGVAAGSHTVTLRARISAGTLSCNDNDKCCFTILEAPSA